MLAVSEAEVKRHRLVDPEELIDDYEERLAVAMAEGGKTQDQAREVALGCLRNRYMIAERSRPIDCSKCIA